MSKRYLLGEVNLDMATVVRHSHGYIKLSSLCSNNSARFRILSNVIAKYGINLVHIYVDVCKQKGPMRISITVKLLCFMPFKSGYTH